MKLNKNKETKESPKHKEEAVNKQVKKKNEKLQSFLDKLEKISPTLKNLFDRRAVEKDKKVKRTLKQSERGIFMIVCSIVACYIIYTFLYTPAIEKKNIVEAEYVKVEKRKNEITTQLENQNAILSSISKDQEKFDDYKKMYPNYRTENEILKVIGEILKKEGVTPTTFIKGKTMLAQKSEMLNFITNKGLTDRITNLGYFQVDLNGEEKTQSEDGVPIVPEADKSNFEHTEVSFSVENITKEQGINIMNHFAESQRVIIPISWKLIAGEKSIYKIEATALFFAYRGSEDIESLF